MGSWLEGTPAGSSSGTATGRPATGPGTLAAVPRRLVALALDWLLSMLVSLVVAPPPPGDLPPLLATDPTVTLVVFAVSTTLFVALLGTTVGHRVVGIQVRRAAPIGDPRPPGLLLALVRTVLLCLVVPAAIWDREGRGMHDVAARTVLVRR